MNHENLLTLLRNDTSAWNEWRRTTYPEEAPVFRGENLSNLNFPDADLRLIDFAECTFRGSNLERANLYRSSLWRADLSNVNLRGSDLSSANLNGANLQNADLSNAILRFARLTAAKVSGAVFSGCFVYGCSFWNLNGTPKEQSNVIITPINEPPIAIDNIEIAQFVYLLLNNHKIRDVIDTIGEKAVLILGRFSEERKPVLESIRKALRDLGYLPMLFDFGPATTQTTMDTISTLAHLSKFIIADLTDAKSILAARGKSPKKLRNADANCSSCGM